MLVAFVYFKILLIKYKYEYMINLKLVCLMFMYTEWFLLLILCINMYIIMTK